MSFKNSLLLLALKLIPIPKRKEAFPKRILVVATTALGDTLWATPALESLRKSFQNAYIAVLTSPVGLEILKENPWTNRLYLLKEPLLPRFFSLWRSLFQEKFDTVLIFHASQRLVLPLCSLLGASRIVGTQSLNKGLDSLLTDALPNKYQHEIVRRLKIVERIGGKIASEKLSIFLRPEEEKASLAKGKWIAIHPGSKDGFKRWPAENFAKLGKILKERLKCEILITGTKSEKDLMEEIAKEIPGAHLSDPNLSLRAFASVLGQVDLLISNDTGPVHLACALKVPVVALYSSTDPNLCGPHRAEKASILFKKRSCDPCLKRKCRSPFCLLQIGVEEVADSAISLALGD